MVKPVLLIRSENNEDDSAALGKLGIPSLVDPYLEITATSDQREGMRLFELLRSSMEPLWVIATSRNSIRYWAQMVGEEQFRAELQTRESLNFAAIGEATAQTLRDYGAPVVFLPSHPDATTLAEELVLLGPRSHALKPAGNLAMPHLPLILRNSGWIVDTAEVYRTSQVSAEPQSAGLLRNGEFSAVLLRSPSAVDALVHFVPMPLVPLVCAGSTTAAAVYAHGLKVDALSPKPTPEAVASTIHSLIFS
ncbi:MAG: uroporphyrinogen-III synthase [Candidatus Nanopelagicaceae bacterium]|nr:uroporphyrinogen-III synthase [Candidatus Nanopelagicaceae bacterium]